MVFQSGKFGKFNLGLRYIADRYSLENYQIDDFVDNSQNINSKTTYLNGSYSKEFPKIKLKLNTENFIFGDNQSNSFSSIVKFNFKNDNSLAINYNFYSVVPSYNTLLYRSNYENYNWHNEFDNSVTNSISLNLILSNILDLDIDLISVKKHVQFEKLIDDNSPGINNYSIIPVQNLNNLEVLKNRYFNYQETTRKVSDYYKKNNSNIFFNINGDHEIDEITDKIKKILKIS